MMTNKEEAQVDIALADTHDDVIEIIARYIETDSQCLMPMRAEYIGETKYAYGLRMLKVLAEEIRELKS